MARNTSLFRDKTITTFIADWKPFIDFLYETEKKNYLMMYGSED